MFCGNCGSKAVEGDRFCVACGREQRQASGSQSMSVLVLEKPDTPAGGALAVDKVDSARPVHQMARSGVPAEEPAEKPLYCRHSPAQRSDLGRYGQDGSQICMGCRLPYAPGSPGSSPDSAALRKTSSGTQPFQSSARPFSGLAIAAFVISLLWLWGIGSIIAVFMASLAMGGTRNGTHAGTGPAVAALVIGILGILVVLPTWLFFLASG